jgi:glycine/D-amino acid oxidase-like deaminating enzyme
MDGPVVICGAGIAGVAAAYALTQHGVTNVVLVEPGNPLSLTSDKSTEAYRNWWPGPEQAMTAFMNRSIDLIEGIACATGNRINLNRRGYAFATADEAKIPFLQSMAQMAEMRGGGPARFHDTGASGYTPSPERGCDFPLTGADVITDAGLIREHFPYFAPETVAVAHARRAGWLSAQQLGMTMLEAARERGVTLVRGTVVGVDAGTRVRAVHVEHAGERRTIETSHLMLAAGPMQKAMAQLIGIDLPLYAERHHKVSFADTLSAVPRSAPMMIWLDEQRLPWSKEERAALEQDEDARWLLAPFPAGVHGRPDGAHATLVLFNHHGEPVAPEFPLPEPPPHYAEIALRGMSTMVPALQAYAGKFARPYVDGGYYMRTRENRQLIGPLPVEGSYV